MRFARSSASISCRHMRFARSSVRVDVSRFARIYCRICMYSMYVYVYIYIFCVCVHVNLHMFEHVYTYYIHMSDCISEHMSNVRQDRCGNTWKGKCPNICRNLCHNVRICTCQHVCQDVYTKGGDLKNYRRVILSHSSRRIAWTKINRPETPT